MRRSINLIIATSLVVGFGLFNTPDFALAQNIQEISYENINPKDGYRYIFKRLGEKITLAILSFSPDKKADYYKKLIQVRFAELKYVVDKKDIANIQTTNQRYFSTAGQATEYVKGKNLVSQKDALKKLLTDHLTLLEVLKKSFNDTTAEWRFLEHNVDYLKLYSAKLTN